MEREVEIFWLDDDKDLFREMNSHVNQGAGRFVFTSLSNDREVLAEIARRHPFAVVLGDGFSNSSIGLLHRIKKISPLTHIIFIAIYARAEAAIHAINEGASDYLPKNPMLSQRLGRLLFKLVKEHSVRNAGRFYRNVYVMAALAIIVLVLIVFILTRY
jgi:DNA-binding NtrC family response regulator